MGGVVDELERLAEADQQQAVRIGLDIDPATLTTEQLVRFHRALGNANRALSRLDAAFEHYEGGVSAAQEHGLAQSEGLIRMSRAGAYSMAGDKAAAIADLDAAEELTTGEAHARVLFQRAVVVQRFSEGLDALEAYDRVIPLLRANGDDLFLAHSLSNRGLIRSYQGDQEAAERDFRAALALYEQMGMPSPAAVVVHNLGLVYTRMLDIPKAFTCFDEAEARLADLGRPLAGLRVDRAETLLSAGLVNDAFELSEATIEDLRRRRLNTDLAEAQLVNATAAVVLGRPDAGDRAAEAAMLFDDQDRPGWRDRAKVLQLDAALANEAVAAADIDTAADLCRRLESVGLRGSASRAALLEGAIALDLGLRRRANEALERGGYSRYSGLIEERLAYWAFVAALRLAENNRRGAMAATRAGLDDLAAYRERVAAPDARVGVAVHAQRLTAAGLRAAAGSRSARTMFQWIERTATPFVELEAAPNSDHLSDLLAELRQVVQALTDSAGAEHELTQQRARLELAIKRESRRRASAPATTTSHHLDQLVTVAAGRQVIAFVDIDGVIHRSVLTAAGRFQHQRLGPTSEAMRQIRSALALLRRIAVRERPADTERLLRTADLLGDLLLSDLDLGDADVIICPRGGLALTPWGIVPQLTTADAAVGFSLSTWVNAHSVGVGPPSSVALIAGPRLPGAREEVQAIADRVGGATVVEPEAATVDAALKALQTSSTVHFACHGDFRSDNPLFSHLEMSDGPLTVYDILSLEGPIATNVVLSSCSGAEVSFRPERAFIGMSGALLTAGVRSLVASVSPVEDSGMVGELMVDLHHRLMTGQAPRSALRAARSGLDTPARQLAAGSFVVLGAG